MAVKPTPKKTPAKALPKRRFRNQAAPNRLTVARVEAALRVSAGIQSVAAEKLKVGRSSICMFMKKHPQLYAVVEEVGAELVDLSVAKLVEQISRGEFQAIRYFLDNRGDAAGFGNMKRYQISGPNGGPIKVESKPKGPDLSKLSMTELEALESLLAKAGPIGDDAPGD